MDRLLVKSNITIHYGQRNFSHFVKRFPYSTWAFLLEKLSVFATIEKGKECKLIEEGAENIVKTSSSSTISATFLAKTFFPIAKCIGKQQQKGTENWETFAQRDFFSFFAKVKCFQRLTPHFVKGHFITQEKAFKTNIFKVFKVDTR